MNTTRLSCRPSRLLRLTLFASLVFLGLVLYFGLNHHDELTVRPLMSPYSSKQYFEKHEIKNTTVSGMVEIARDNSTNDAVTHPTFEIPALALPRTSSPLSSINTSKNSANGSYDLRNLGKDVIDYCSSAETRVGNFVVCPMFLPSLHSKQLAQASNKSIASFKRMFNTRLNGIIDENLFKENTAMIRLAFVTQCSSNRLDRITTILERWNGPVSLAVFVENVTVLREVIRWYNFQLAEKKSQILNFLDIHIVMDDPRKKVAGEYPINFLRNVAMDLTLVPWILVADADAMPSNDAKTFLQDLERGVHFNELVGMENRRAVNRSTYLVPSFETTIHYNLSIEETPSSKEAILALYDARVVLPMHHYFRPAYMPTDYERWSRVDNPFHVPYQLYFEPYYIARITATDPPRYDDRFTNYGKNKAQQNYELQAMGYTMTVLPNVFIMDMGHPEGSNWRREFDIGKMISLMNQFRVETDVKLRKEKWHDRSNDVITWFNLATFTSDLTSDL